MVSFNKGFTPPNSNMFQDFKLRENILRNSKYVQVLFNDRSEKIYEIIKQNQCKLIISKNPDSDEWHRPEANLNKPGYYEQTYSSVDREIRLKGFCKVKPITEEEIALNAFDSLL